MKNIKHTPGPWNWVDQKGEDMPRLMGNGREVCNFGRNRTYYPTEGEAPDADDARLIAAAPELLEALVALVDAYEKDAAEAIYKPWLEPVAVAARAAIAKATTLEIESPA